MKIQFFILTILFSILTSVSYSSQVNSSNFNNRTCFTDITKSYYLFLNTEMGLNLKLGKYPAMTLGRSDIDLETKKGFGSFISNQVDYLFIDTFKDIDIENAISLKVYEEIKNVDDIKIAIERLNHLESFNENNNVSLILNVDIEKYIPGSCKTLIE